MDQNQTLFDSLETKKNGREADLVTQIEHMHQVARQNNFFTEPDEIISPKQHLVPQVISHRGLNDSNQVYSQNKDRKTPTNL